MPEAVTSSTTILFLPKPREIRSQTATKNAGAFLRDYHVRIFVADGDR